MKSLISFISVLLCANIFFAQAPHSMTYQAVIRDENSALLVEQTVGIKVSILENSEVGNPVYVEVHSSNTNTNGLITLEIGNGNVLQGLFNEINWQNGIFFIKTEIDPSGGNNYSIQGVSKLQSVPYSFYATSAGNGLEEGTLTNQIKYWNGNAWVNLNPGLDGQVLTLCNGQLKWTNYGLCEGTIESLNCNAITISGILEQNTFVQDLIIEIPYLGGDGEWYPSTSFYSNGVEGYSAELPAGSFNFGNGSLYFTVTGASNEIGEATFTIHIGGQSCIVTIPVTPSLGSTGPLSVGSYYGGGIVGYIFQPNEPGYVQGEIHGLIISSTDVSSSASWGCQGTAINGADGYNLGSGFQNTIDIISTCTNTSIAASLCYNYVSENYDDWYLPSGNELFKILDQLTSNSNSLNSYYWSSTEVYPNTAYYLYRPTYSPWGSSGPGFGTISKSTNLAVRAVRNF